MVRAQISRQGTKEAKTRRLNVERTATSPSANPFDADYYRRFYTDPRTRVASQRDIDRLGDFVCSYLKYLRLSVRSVLDVGCGMGFWQKVVRRHFPRAKYTGVEYSEHLCRTKKWIHGSVVDFQSPAPFDFVICQGVLQYLTTRDAQAAIDNLSRLCQGALYLEALTKGDWATVCDRDRTDGQMQMRTGKWYRRRLAPHFTSAGGGVFVRKGAAAHLYELEQGEISVKGSAMSKRPAT